MPQAMSIQASPPRREVQQFQAHSHYDPCDDQSRPHCPVPSRCSVFLETEPTPHYVLCDPNHHICHHVVCVIPLVPFQICNVRCVQSKAEPSPCAQKGFRSFSSQVKPVYPNRGIVEAIENARPGRKVVQFFSEPEVPRVEDHAKHPTCHPKVCQKNVVFAHRVGGGYARCDFREAVLVSEEVEEREEDGERLLHAEEAVERPFPVELDDSYTSRDALVGDYVLAGVVAFCWAVPEKEAMEEGWRALDRVWRSMGVLTDCRHMVAITILLLADLRPISRSRWTDGVPLTSTQFWNSGRRSPYDAETWAMSRLIPNTTRRSRSGEVELFLKIIVTMRKLDASKRRFHRGRWDWVWR
jgi:hypothetical protein